MIYRLLLFWMVISNETFWAKAIPGGYYSSGNSFYQEPAGFLGWGSRSDGYDNVKSSGKGKGKSHPTTGTPRGSTTTNSIKQSIKSKHKKTTEDDERSTKSYEKILPPIPLSPELVQMIQTGPTVTLDGSTMHYIPLAQMATADPSLFLVPNQYQQRPFSVYPEIVPPYADPAKTMFPQAVLPPMRPSLYQHPLSHQVSLPQTPYFQNSFQGAQPHLFPNKVRPFVNDDYDIAEKTSEPEKLPNKDELKKFIHSSLLQLLKEHNLAAQTDRINSYEVDEEAPRHTLFVHPRLVDLMRSMDHSLLSFPSRFDYRPVKIGHANPSNVSSYLQSAIKK